MVVTRSQDKLMKTEDSLPVDKTSDPNESTTNNPSVNKETKGDTNETRKSKLEKGTIGTVNSGYKGMEEVELDLEPGYKVRVINDEGQWCTVALLLLEGEKEGYVLSKFITPDPVNDVKSNIMYRTTHFIIIILPAISILLYFILNNCRPLYYSSFNLTDRLIKLKDQNPHITDEKIWFTVESCLRNVMNGRYPCIMLMLNDGREDFRDFFQGLGHLSVDMFNDEYSEIIPLTGSTLNDNRYSFDKCKGELKMKKVLLVDETEKIPSSILEQFHSLCDIYDPAVKQSVIMFMLNYKGSKVKYIRNDATFAMDVLNEIWNGQIDPDITDALFTRIAENIIILTK